MKADRRFITGELDATTPWCVLEEIALSHSLAFERSRITDPFYNNKVLLNIHYTDLPTIPVEPSEWSNSDLRKIVKFVNPDTSLKWNRQTLEEAFLFLFDYTQSYTVPPSPKLGPQTPDQTRSLNCCVVYRLIRREGITVKITTTPEEMWDVLLTAKLPRNYLLNQLQSNLTKYTTGQLITALLERGIEFRPKILSGMSLESFSKVPAKITIEQATQDPVTAVAYAALNGLNFCSLKFPTLEVAGISKTGFTPVSDHVKAKLALDPHYYSLVHHFEPLIPLKYYTAPTLVNACTAYGHEPVPGNANTYNLLCELVLSNNFYHGRLSTITNVETVTGETVAEIPDNELICYGVRDLAVTAMTYDELFRHFEVVGMPTNPFVRPGEPKFFTEQQLKRLLFLSTAHQKQGVKERLTGYLSRDVLDKQIMTFKNVREEPSHRKKFDDLLLAYRNMVMYARGWDGVGPLPITQAGVHTFTDEAGIKTFQAIRDLEDMDSRFKTEVGVSLLEFPLLDYDKDTNTYIKMTAESKGRTIGERLQIILYSEQKVSGKEAHFGKIDGCIRTSSNYLGRTYHYIMTRLGLDPGFDIKTFVYTP